MPNPMPQIVYKRRRPKGRRLMDPGAAAKKDVMLPAKPSPKGRSFPAKGTSSQITTTSRFGGSKGTTLQERTASRAKRLGLEVKDSYTRGEARSLRRRLALRRSRRMTSKAESLL